MATNALIMRNTVHIGDLSVASITAKYKIGETVEMATSDKEQVKKYQYVKAGAALTAYIPYKIVDSKDGVTVVAAATTAIGICRVSVPQFDVASGSYFWIQTAGPGAKAKTSSITAADKYIEIVNSASAGVDTSKSAVSSESFAITTATSSDNYPSIYIFDKQTEIKSS